MNRSGVALIIVLMILMGLMLLGLPFLFSQRWSLSGARSVQAGQSLRIYLSGSEHLGTALGVYANAGAWTLTQDTASAMAAQQHSALDKSLAGMAAAPLATGSTANNDRILTGAFGGNTDPAVRTGLSLSDESGCIDPNLLDAQGWWDLFQKLGIPDWTDSSVTDADKYDLTPTPHDRDDGNSTPELCDELEWYRINKGPYLRLEDLRQASAQNSARRWRPTPKFRKRLSAGELERLRPYLSFHNLPPGRLGLTDLGTVITSDQDLVTPAISTAHPHLNMSGLRIVFDVDPTILNTGTWSEVLDTTQGTGTDLRPALWSVNPGNGTNPTTYSLRYPGQGMGSAYWGMLPGKGSALWLAVPSTLNVHQLPEPIRSLPAYVAARQAGGPGTSELPNPASDFPIRWYGQPSAADSSKPALLWDYLNPRFLRQGNAIPHERQPLDLRGDGLFRITAAATIAERSGGIAAQGERTTIVQAIPQEKALERRWMTQGQWEPLVAQRFTSHMTTWPRATARATDIVPSDTDPSSGALPDNETGVSFTPNISPGSGSVGNALSNMRIKWRVPLGNGVVGATQADVLKEFRSPATTPGNGPVDDGGSAKPPPPVVQTGNEGLFPDGIRIASTRQLAYAFDIYGGPLRMAQPALRSWPTVAPAPPAPSVPRDASLNNCHIGFWFCPQSDWTDPGAPAVITLAEARQSQASAGRYVATSDLTSAMGTLIPQGTAEQNYFGVFYDRKQNMLVAAYTPPSATLIYDPAIARPAVGPLSWTAAVDDTTNTPDKDERCGPGTDWLTPPRLDAAACKRWSPTFLPNRIMTCWKLGRRIDASGSPRDIVPEKGRWYHLQIVIGNGRPGSIGIALDGLVGSDVGLMRAQLYLASRQGSTLKGPWPGDHLTLPSLLLDQSLDPMVKSTDGVTDALPAEIKKLYPDTIKIAMPGFSAFAGSDYSSTSFPDNPANGALTPMSTLPPRGSVLIGDEYIRYESIQTTGSGSSTVYQLKNCTRGIRQDSQTTDNKNRSSFPTTEAHVAGERVLTDGYRVPLTGRANNDATPDATNLLRGGTKTMGEVGSGLAAEYVISATILTPRTPTLTPILVTTNPTLTLDPGGGWVKAPKRGYVKLHCGPGGSSIQYYFYTSSAPGSLTVTLEDPAKTWSTAESLVKQVPASVFGANPTFTSTDADPAYVELISMEVDDVNDPLDRTMFNWPNGARSDSMLQLLDPGTGRCEWLTYTNVIRRKTSTDPALSGTDAYPAGTGVYFISTNAWNYNGSTDRDRGKQRTVFDDSLTFPVGTKVIPVQSRRGGSINVDYKWCKAAAPGDFVTLVPADASQPAVVAVVRYCANDGYGTPASPLNDTVNGWLAFTDSLNNLVQPYVPYELVMGTGFNTLRDLTPLDSGRIVTFKPSAMPRLDYHGAGRLVLGSGDTARGGDDGVGMAIDTPYGGDWPSSAGRILRVYDETGNPLDGYTILSSGDLPLYIEADTDVFSQNGGVNGISLLEIGGEVFACQLPISAPTTVPNSPPGDTQFEEPAAVLTLNASHPGRIAKIIGRGLLGSRMAKHPFSQSPPASQFINEQIAYWGSLDLGPEFFRLPIGPVRLLHDRTAGNQAPADLSAIVSGAASQSWFGISDVVGGANAARLDLADSTQMSAPAWMVCNPVPASAAILPWKNQIEMLTLAGYDNRDSVQAWDYDLQQNIDLANPNPNRGKYTTGAWQRGLYNTPATATWAPVSSGRGTLAPLLIGVWPRYASCLPPTTTTLDPAHFRSRSFPWINLPLRLHNMRLHDGSGGDTAPTLVIDGTQPVNETLTAAAGSDADIMQLEARAMIGNQLGVTNAPYSFNDAGMSIKGDWNHILGLTIPPIAASADQQVKLTGLFPWNGGGAVDQAKEVDGVEIRLSFRYTRPSSTDLTEIARWSNRAPLIGGAKLRCYAPVTTIAVEGAR